MSENFLRNCFTPNRALYQSLKLHPKLTCKIEEFVSLSNITLNKDSNGFWVKGSFI